MRIRTTALCLAALLCAGCVVELMLFSTTVIGGASILQRWEDRGVQQQQNDEIRLLREEISRLRQQWRGAPVTMPDEAVQTK